ncbi:hypothetical protein SCOR_04840 [Sulfidibacter corallicola]
MEIGLYLAAFLILLVGMAHSILGERYILTRLFRRENLPKVLGSSEFTARTLRFAWHVTTVAWLGLASVLIALAHPPVTVKGLGLIVGGTFLIHFAISVVGSRGKHLSWPLFLAIGVLAIYATHA